MNKVILLDGGILSHRAIFQWGSIQKKILQGTLSKKQFNNAGYTYFSIIISALKKVGLDKDDIVIMALDGRNSWRKDLLASYKAQRQSLRDEHEHIPWYKKYNEINKINSQLNQATNFNFLIADRIEADDIIAVACRYFKDRKKIIVSGDQDLEQLAYYPETYIFSLYSKYKGSAGAYKEIKNPHKVLADKLKKGDVSDNILISDDDDENDIEIRNTIMNLLTLPNWVEEKVKLMLNQTTLDAKLIDESKLPFPNSLAKRFPQVYEKGRIITPEEVEEYRKRKQKKARKKKKETKSLR